MYINRLLLLVAGIVLIFFPAIESWVIDSATAWYRPYQIVAFDRDSGLLEPAHEVSG